MQGPRAVHNTGGEPIGYSARPSQLQRLKRRTERDPGVSSRGQISGTSRLVAKASRPRLVFPRGFPVRGPSRIPKSAPDRSSTPVMWPRRTRPAARTARVDGGSRSTDIIRHEGPTGTNDGRHEPGLATHLVAVWHSARLPHPAQPAPLEGCATIGWAATILRVVSCLPQAGSPYTAL